MKTGRIVRIVFKVALLNTSLVPIIAVRHSFKSYSFLIHLPRKILGGAPSARGQIAPFLLLEHAMPTDQNEIDATQSAWLRNAKLALLNRDPVDAANDADALAKFAQKRLEALLNDTP